MKIIKDKEIYGVTSNFKKYKYSVDEVKEVSRCTFTNEVRKKFKVMRNQANQIIAYADKNNVSFDEAYKVIFKK